MTLALHYEDTKKQTHAARLGMWVFVASEMMFFAALFGLYAALRAAHPDEFGEAVRHSEVALGTTNTVLLLTSSLLAVLAVDSVRHGRTNRARLLLVGTALLGLAFLGLKGLEYARHIREGVLPGSGAGSRGAQMFFDLYYAMTGLHALHVVVGISLLGWLAKRAHALRPDEHGHIALELGALYWHFVDVIWLFLWPLFYLLK